MRATRTTVPPFLIKFKKKIENLRIVLENETKYLNPVPRRKKNGQGIYNWKPLVCLFGIIKVFEIKLLFVRLLPIILAAIGGAIAANPRSVKNIRWKLKRHDKRPRRGPKKNISRTFRRIYLFPLYI